MYHVFCRWRVDQQTDRGQRTQELRRRTHQLKGGLQIAFKAACGMQIKASYMNFYFFKSQIRYFLFLSYPVYPYNTSLKENGFSAEKDYAKLIFISDMKND